MKESRARDARLHWETAYEKRKKEYLQDIPENHFDEESSKKKADFVGWKLNSPHCLKHFSSKIVAPDGAHKERAYRNADFRWADLWGVEFDGGHFYQADFEGAMLANSRFGKADVSAANFRDADLGEADLSHTKGLMPANLSGAKLANARLPEQVRRFERLGRADKAAQSAKSTLIALLGACLYCWLTIAATNDADLIQNSTKTPLPIVNTEISLRWFYFVAPAVLLAGYVYLHYYLQSMWQDLSNLPAVFPDGEFVDEKVDPWPMRLVVAQHSWFLRHARSLGLVELIQYAAAVVLAWIIVPVTIIGFWFRFLPTHHQGAWFLLFLSLGSLFLLAATFRLAVVTLWERGRGQRLGSDRRLMQALPLLAWVLGGIALAAISALMIIYTLLSFEII